ncbi:hypothetical protein SAMN05444003_2110, partial [Cognatiyoonia sediminum]
SVSSPLLGGCDVPETLSYQITLNCPISADVRQIAKCVTECVTIKDTSQQIDLSLSITENDGAQYAEFGVSASCHPQETDQVTDIR